jgi:hypothetical protein
MSQRLIINGAPQYLGGKLVLNADQIQYVKTAPQGVQIVMNSNLTRDFPSAGTSQILTIVTNSGTTADADKLRDGINAALTSSPGGRVVEVANNFGGIDSVIWVGFTGF